MNTFYEYEDIFGRAETAHLNRSFAELFELAASIRRRLGRQAYLLDEYISLLLKGANATLIQSAAEGFRCFRRAAALVPGSHGRQNGLRRSSVV